LKKCWKWQRCRNNSFKFAGVKETEDCAGAKSSFVSSHARNKLNALTFYMTKLAVHHLSFINTSDAFLALLMLTVCRIHVAHEPSENNTFFGTIFLSAFQCW